MNPWRVLSWWASNSHERSLANARLGAVEVSRRRLERVEVDDFLRGLAEQRAADADVTTLTARRR